LYGFPFKNTGKKLSFENVPALGDIVTVDPVNPEAISKLPVNEPLYEAFTDPKYVIKFPNVAFLE
jgi:hypothetical protein